MAVASVQHIVYGLIDPRTDQIRYVGKSSCGLLRPRQHWMHKAQRESYDYCHNWVRNVLAAGREPEIFVLEESSAEQLNEHEMFWISYLRMVGANLTNMTRGGDGWSGPMPPEIREKISKAGRGRKQSKETKAKRAASHRGRKCSPETLARMSSSAKGRVVSSEIREKIANTLRGRPLSEETKEKISNALVGRKRK